MVRDVARMGWEMNIVLAWKSTGKRPLGKPRRRWKEDITVDLKERGREDVDSIQLVDCGGFLWTR